MINEAFFSKFIVENIEYDDDKVLILLKPNKQSAKCTCCGTNTTKVHSKYERKVLDLPMLDKYTTLTIIVRRFFCNNINCKRKIFSEQFDGFLLRYKRLTERISNYLIKLGLTQSANQVERLLKKFIPISSSSILRLTKNYNLTIKYDAEFIDIDDFSFKKGVTFGSIICDLKTGKPIDIINSRNLDEVTNHLRLYKNAKIVSRDRSTTYAKAIKDALPKATQVADRFHIIHNFLEGICDFLKSYIGKAIKIVKEDTEKIIIKKDKYIDNEKSSKKKEVIRKVQELYLNGMPIRQIVRKLSLSRNTVRKYIKIDDIEAVRYNNKPTQIYFHKELMIDLLVNKKPYKDILLEIDKLGVKYSYSSLAKLANELKKEGLPNEVGNEKQYIFTRYNLIKIFWNYSDNTSELYSILKLILDKYPMLDEVFLAIALLREVLNAKDLKLLDEWIAYYSNSKIKEIKSFVNGVLKDYTSVANAIIYHESNGILEGNVNRLKYIKRSMFGRASFQLLRNKVLMRI